MIKRIELWKLLGTPLVITSIFVTLVLCLSYLLPVSSWAEEAVNIGHYLVFSEREVDPDNPKPTEQHEQTVTGSSVNHLTRSYSTGNPGLSMKVPGGSFRLNSSYEKGSWGFGSARSGMNGWGFGQSGLGFHEICGEYGTPIITSIIKDGKYNYNLPPENVRKVTHYDPEGNMLSESCEYVGEQVYIHEGKKQAFVIRKTDDGYHWEDKYGNWRLYGGKSEDAGSGQLLSSGNRRGKTEQALYDAGHKIIGYADRDGNQVVWIEYTGDLVSAVRDSANRRIEYTYDVNGRLWKVKDVLGYETEYLYDADDRLITVNKPGGRESHITYNDSGDVASVLNVEGKGYYFEFDYDKTKKEYYALVRSTSGRIKEIWYDEEGDTKRIDVNGTTVQTIVKDGNALLIIDERGLQTRKEYDEWDNLTKVIYPDNSTVSYAYEHTYNRRIREIDERGVVTEYLYDDNKNLQKMIEAVGTDVERMTEFTYYDDGTLKSIKVQIDEDTTAETIVHYDEVGNVTQMTDREHHTTYFTSHDIMGNVLTKIDARGKEWTYQYDNMGRLISMTDPLTNTIQYMYNVTGNLEKIIDPNGHETTYTYDHQGNLIHIEDAAKQLTTFEYNADNQLIRHIDQEGSQIGYEYDTYGRQTKILYGNEDEIVMEYDDFPGSSCTSCIGGGSANQPRRIIYPTFTKEFSYDNRGRKTEEVVIFDEGTDEKQYRTRFFYDEAGNLLSIMNPENHTIHYEYDALNRLISITRPGGKIQYTYNVQDKLRQLTDAKQHVTRFEYDKNGRIKKEIRPMNQETEYWYDEVGNQIRKRDAEGQITEYGYNDAERLTQILYDDGRMVTFTYDKTGNLESYDDGLTSAIFSYDVINRKTSETVNYGDFSKTFQYSYFTNGLKKTLTVPDGTTYQYTYDSHNRLTSISIPGIGDMIYQSYTWSHPNGLIFPGGTRQENQYDPLLRIQSLVVTDPGQNIVLNYHYTYDKIHNILGKTSGQEISNYTYDTLYQLTQMNVDEAEQSNEAFTYDVVGNRLTEDGIEGEWMYNDNDELLMVADVEYTYDANGNMRQRRTGTTAVNYIYNTANRLVKIEEDLTNAVLAEYYYDPFGRRLWKEVGGIKTYFFYSDEGLIGEYDSNGIERRSYGYTPGQPWTPDWTTNPLFMKQGEEYYFFQNDHLGTPMKLVGVNGAVVWSATYQVYGTADVHVSAVSNPLRLAGQYYDEESGLHYNYHRYYDPRTGRYLRPDPLRRTNGINVYAFVHNNPLRMKDPMGLITIDKSCEGREDIIESDVKATCDRMKEAIPDSALNECIQKHCKDGKVSCGGIKHSFFCWLYDPAPGYCKPPGDPDRTAYLCWENFDEWNNNYGEDMDCYYWYGDTVVHEWAHGCRKESGEYWDHPENPDVDNIDGIPIGCQRRGKPPYVE